MSNEPELRPRPRRFPLIIAWFMATLFAVTALWMLFVAFNLRTANNLLETERDLARVSDRLARSQLEERTFLAEKIINELKARAGVAGDERTAPAADIEGLRVAFLETEASASSHARVAVIWDPARGSGLLVGKDLPRLGPGEIFQLWVEAKGAARSVGTFEIESTTLSEPIALHETKSFDAFRLTIEKSPAPTKPQGRTVGSARL